MPYEGQERRWAEENLRDVAAKLSEVDRFMGQQQEIQKYRSEQLEALEASIADIRRAIESNNTRVEKSIQDTNTKVDGLLSKINKWEAKLGSFMFIAGCLWAAFMGFKDNILAFIKG